MDLNTPAISKIIDNWIDEDIGRGDLTSPSITDENGLWIGSGFIRRVNLIDNIYINFDFFPGLYIQNDEENLGGWLMFRSGIELEFKLDNLWNISFAYDHRSSGDIWKYNPGLETIKLSLSRYIR